MFSAGLNCVGRLTGAIIISGGPNTGQGQCGGFQETGSVAVSANGLDWTVKASWSCSQGTTATASRFPHAGSRLGGLLVSLRAHVDPRARCSVLLSFCFR